MTRRLLRGYLAVTLFVLLVLEIPLAVVYGQRERERLASGAEHDATVLATFYEDDLERGRTLDATAAARFAADSDVRVVILNALGASAVDTGGPTGRDFSSRPEVARALAGRTARGRRHSDTLDTDLLYVAVPVASGGVVHGAVRITVDEGHVDDRIHVLWGTLAAVGVVVLVAVSGIAWLEARAVTRPVRELDALARRFSAGDLSAPGHLQVDVPELAALGTTMTRMADRLRALLGEQERFVADASHQLRTPLTSMRLRLENLEQQVPSDTREEIGVVLGEIDRLAALVTDLLRLARATEHPGTVETDVVRIAAERVSTWTALAELDDVDLVLDVTASDGVELHALSVPGAVEQVLDNLIENALEATPARSTVTVLVGRDAGGVRLEVRDQGPGLTPAERSQATERFWRGSTAAAGTGLGLAVVDSLVVASGGRLALEAVSPHGLAAVVHLPVTDGTT
jgi:signal transduction histidine kinase